LFPFRFFAVTDNKSFFLEIRCEPLELVLQEDPSAGSAGRYREPSAAEVLDFHPAVVALVRVAVLREDGPPGFEEHLEGGFDFVRGSFAFDDYLKRIFVPPFADADVADRDGLDREPVYYLPFAGEPHPLPELARKRHTNE